MLKYFILGGFIIYLIIFLYFCFKTKHFFKTLILNLFIGIISLVILSLLSNITGLEFNINRGTVFTSSFLGIPGLLTLLTLNMFF